jgi:hypothetical protein
MLLINIKMKGPLFKIQELEDQINTLIINAISLQFPLKQNEVIKYQNILNFADGLIDRNKNITWDYELIETLKDKLNWSYIYRWEGITIDFAFYQKYNQYLHIQNVIYSRNVIWEKNLLGEAKKVLDWQSRNIFYHDFITKESLYEHFEELDWDFISRQINKPLSEELIDEFIEYWNWDILSRNFALPITFNFIVKYKEKLNFDSLSGNPNCLPIILKYPHSNKWNWKNILSNFKFEISDDNYEYYYKYFNKFIVTKYPNLINNDYQIRAFYIDRLLKYNHSELTFLFKKPEIHLLEKIVIFNSKKTKIDFITLTYLKNKLDFKSDGVIYAIRDAVTPEFIIENIDYFKLDSYLFYKLPINYEMLKLLEGKINWNLFSSCTTFDWNWDFILKNLKKLNINRLAENQKVFELIKQNLNGDILIFLENFQENYQKNKRN